MTRSTSSPRRAPLPADAAARLHRSVGRRLSAALDDPELVGLVVALREACRGSPALRQACGEAIAAETPLFIKDWFGIVPQAALTADRSRPRQAGEGITHAV